jgi:lysophospholipase L1-like esterase
MPAAPVLVIAPPPVLIPRGPIAAKFLGAADKCAGLAEAYRIISSELGCHFFDAASVTKASAVDGIHLDADQHRSLGKALAQCVAALPGVLPPATT